MAQIFHPSFNTIARASILGIVILTCALSWALWKVWDSNWVTLVGEPQNQPVPFSHKHHVGGLGLDCRYCHTSVEDSDFAGLPATKVCMTCHSQIWTNAQILEPVRESWRTGQPIAWRRVHDLPDYAHFRHSIHINRGVACVTCHGQVNEMPITWKNASLQMRWCLDCHRHPEAALGPRDQVTNMSWPGRTDQAAAGVQKMKDFHISTEQITNCSICHY